MTFRNAINLTTIAPGFQLAYTQVMTDGTLFLNAVNGSTFLLKPSTSGTYHDGTIERVGDQPKTALYGPVNINVDGKLIQHIGEYGSSLQFEGSNLGGFTCTYNPETKVWESSVYGVYDQVTGGRRHYRDGLAYHNSTHMTDDGRLISPSNMLPKTGVVAGNSISPYLTGHDLLSLDIGEHTFVHLPDGTAVAIQVKNSTQNGYDLLWFNPGYSSEFIAAGSAAAFPNGVNQYRINLTSQLNTAWNALPTNKKWRNASEAVTGSTTPFRITSPGPAIHYELGAALWSPKLNKIVILSGSGYVITMDRPTIQFGEPQTNLNVTLAAEMPMETRNPAVYFGPDHIGVIKSANNGQTIAQAIAGGSITVTYQQLTSNGNPDNQDTLDRALFVDTANGWALRTGAADGLKVKAFHIRTANATRWVRVDYTGVSLSGASDVTFTGCSITAFPGDTATALTTGDSVVQGCPQYKTMDAPAAFLPNGDIVFAAGVDKAATAGYFSVMCRLFKFDGTSVTPLDGAVGRPLGDSHNAGGEFATCLQPLPNGEIAWVTQGELKIYTPTTAEMTPFSGSRPTIISTPSTIVSGGQFTMRGRQANGLHEGGAFGDDKSQRTNHPIVRLTSLADGSIKYCTTRDFEYRGIQPNRDNTFNVKVPAGLTPGSYSMELVASGVPVQTPSTVTVVSSDGGESMILNYAGDTVTATPAAIYVAPTGNNNNAGTISFPKATLAGAILAAPTTGGSIIMRAGVYPESVEVLTKSINISAYPGEEVWIDGSTTISTSWTAATGPTRWTTPWTQWQTAFTSTTTYPQLQGNVLAGDPMMVWFNGVELTKVGSAAAVVANTFFSDRTNNLLVIGNNPAGATVIIAHRKDGIFVNTSAASGTVIDGLKFRRFATPMDQQAAVKIFAPSCTVQNVTVEDTANSGIYVYDAVNASNVTIANCTLRRIGQIGIGGSRCDRLMIRNCNIDLPNYKSFAIDQATGGVKITVAKNVTIQDNTITNSSANGIWLDQSCRGGIIQRNTVVSTVRNAIEVEISNTCSVLNNIINDCNGDGIEINESNDITVTGNTLTNVDGWCLRVLEGARTPTTQKTTGYTLNSVVYPANPGDLDSRTADPWPETSPGVFAPNAFTAHTITITGNDCSARPGTQGNSFFGYEDVANQSNHIAANMTINNNTYRWNAQAAGPQWVGNVETGTAPVTQQVASTMAAWRTLNGNRYDMQSTLVTNAAGFSIASNGNILNPSGNLFVPIGMNAVPRPVPAPTSGFWLNTMRYATGHVSDFTSRSNWNTMRLTCWHDEASEFTQQNIIDGILACIDEYTAQNVVMIPANHEWTRSDVPAAATQARLEADNFFLPWYNAMLDKAKINQYVWVNPLNEPYDYLDNQGWVDVHNYLYTYARNRGYNGILVFDLPGFGQDISFLSNSLLTSFMIGKTNVVLGYHNYEVSDSVSNQYVNTNYPVIVGEAGRTVANGFRDASFQWCVTNARTTNWGLLAWWGAGNTSNTLTFRTATGSAWYETTSGLSAMGSAMETL
jgi:parallel beta-helix repeat protein